MTTTGTTFAALLAAYRTERGLSQSQLAHQAGYDHAHISRLESGLRRPTFESVARLADALALAAGQLDRLTWAACMDAKRRWEDRHYAHYPGDRSFR